MRKTVQVKAEKMAGRPSSYTQEKADYICQELAEGRSLRKICEDDGMPSAGTVCRWLTDFEQFQQQYARARESQADALFEEILDIADEAQTTTKLVGQGEDAEEIITYDSVAVARNRLRVDARKWMAGKLRPKKYGEKLELSGDSDNPLTIQTIKRVIIDPNQ